MRRKFFFFFPLAVIALSAVVMLLWNYVLAEVAPVGKIHFFQAAGLLVLSRILFGGFHFGGWRGKRFYGPPPHIRARWMNMSDEERQRFREEWKKRCERRSE
jgi:hypothetical protein